VTLQAQNASLAPKVTTSVRINANRALKAALDALRIVAPNATQILSLLRENASALKKDYI
jgi:hypothetical protein